MEEILNTQAFYIRHEKYSWALFAITPKGDLFINSDWGTFGFAWRAFGADFKKFLCQMGGDYLIGKLESNVTTTVRGARPFHMKKAQEEAVIGLFTAFQEHLRQLEPVAAEPVTIPPMTHPFGKVWEAPDRSEVTIDGAFAKMTKAAFDKLLDYSRSVPSGVYEGKMWKTSDDKITWHLHWWSAAKEPDMCSGNTREIKIID